MTNMSAADDVSDESEFKVKLSRLIGLCIKQQKLEPREFQERDGLLTYFRKKAFTSKEISDMIEGRLKDDTIRKLTAGVEVEESSLKERIAELIGKMVRADLAFGSAKKALLIQEGLAAKGVTIEDISSLLDEASRAEYDDAWDIVSMYKDQKASGLSFKRLDQALDYKVELDRIGLKIENLEPISKVANKNGRDAGKVLEAVASFDNLEAIKGEIGKKEEDLDELNKRYENAKAETEKADGENAHLREAIALCKDMIGKYGFTKAALSDIYELAKKCGNPFEVMSVLAEYANLTAQIKSLSGQKTTLSSQVNELQESLNKLKGQQEAIVNSVKGLLEPVSNEISKAFADAVKVIARTYEEQLRILKGASQKYGERLGKSLALEEELKFAKVINLIIKYPLEAKELPLGYTIIMLDAAKKLLFAKRVEAKIKAGPAGITDNSLCENIEVDAIALVEGAIRALETNARV
jgi:predicted  nucleic acid-binding Zn-ribbon protein